MGGCREVSIPHLSRQARTFVPAEHLTREAGVAAWNDDPRPFIWHKTADQILDNLENCLTNV